MRVRVAVARVMCKLLVCRLLFHRGCTLGRLCFGCRPPKAAKGGRSTYFYIPLSTPHPSEYNTDKELTKGAELRIYNPS